MAYLDYQGSGNETARHSLAGGPVTIMVMSMDGDDAAIVRLYGRASISAVEDSPLADRLLAAPAEELNLPQRHVVQIHVDGTQTSCGYGVPAFSYLGERTSAGRGRRYKDG